MDRLDTPSADPVDPRDPEGPDDPVDRALGYPGAMLRVPALLTGTGCLPWRGDVGRDERVPVLAIGSNGSPSTLRRKLLAAGEDVHVPMEPVLALGMGVAHSAHVSAGGYVAAAPFDNPGGVTRAVLLWLDPAQQRAVDRTEPNYQRASVSVERYRLVTSGSRTPVRFGLYRSVWGVLSHDGHVVRLRNQPRLHTLLRRDPAVAVRLPLDDPRATVRALQHRRTQDWLRRHWAHHDGVGDGVVAPS